MEGGSELAGDGVTTEGAIERMHVVEEVVCGLVEVVAVVSEMVDRLEDEGRIRAHNKRNAESSIKHASKRHRANKVDSIADLEAEEERLSGKVKLWCKLCGADKDASCMGWTWASRKSHRDGKGAEGCAQKRQQAALKLQQAQATPPPARVHTA